MQIFTKDKVQLINCLISTLIKKTLNSIKKIGQWIIKKHQIIGINIIIVFSIWLVFTNIIRERKIEYSLKYKSEIFINNRLKSQKNMTNKYSDFGALRQVIKSLPIVNYNKKNKILEKTNANNVTEENNESSTNSNQKCKSKIGNLDKKIADAEKQLSGKNKNDSQLLNEQRDNNFQNNYIQKIPETKKNNYGTENRESNENLESKLNNTQIKTDNVSGKTISNNSNIISSPIITSTPNPNPHVMGQDSSEKEFIEDKYLEMVATAYDLSVESCGKAPDHPGYGITYSGTKAKKGRTIAVDPQIIPIGTQVYVEILDSKFSELSGYYIAEDTGGLIKGNKIDIFIGELEPDYAKCFGIQNCKVYLN